MAFVQAGTAISDRNKGESNSFNLIQAGCAENGEKQVIVHRYSWVKSDDRFECKDSEEFRLGKQGWAEFRPVHA